MSTTVERGRIVRSSSDGSLIIPAELRRELGIGENTLLTVRLVDGELRVKPVPEEELRQGSPWLRELYDHFAPVRQEAIEEGFTEQQINDWIDEAIAGYRRDQGD